MISLLFSCAIFVVNFSLMSVCAAPTCSDQSFDGSSYYVDVDVDKEKTRIS